jgi:hypothetical protein
MDSAEDIARMHGEGATGSPPPPRVFVRSFTAPPALPWVQGKAADLEAQHGAPLPLKDVTYRLRRLEAWRPGPGRFAAFYVRRAEFRESFETRLEVDGRVIDIRFVHPADERQRSRQVGLVAVAVAATVAVGAVSIAASLGQRTAATAQLEAAEQRAASQLRAAQVLQRRQEQSRRLEQAARGDHPVSDVLADISWVSANKIPTVRIEALHWDHGVLAIEARGEESPLGATDRQVVRSDRPVRPGIWAWGAASLARAGGARPVSASLANPEARR